MSTLLFFIVIIVIFFVVKFIYDSYLTDNTEKEWQRYKSDFPEKARKIEGRRGDLDFEGDETLLNKTQKEQSIRRLAKNYGCEVWEVKERFLEEISKECSLLSLTQFKETFTSHIQKESLLYNLKEENTASSISLNWLKESNLFIEDGNTKDFDYNKTQYTSSEIEEWLLGKKAGFAVSFFRKNPEIFIEFSNDFHIYKDDLGLWVVHFFINKDEYRFWDDKAFMKLFPTLLEIGLYLSTSTESRLSLNFNKIVYLIKVYEKINRIYLIEEADIIINSSLKLLDKENPNDFNYLKIFYDKKAYVLGTLCDYQGAVKFSQLSKFFENKQKEFKELDDTDDELPF